MKTLRCRPSGVDDLRVHAGREPGPRAGGEFILYWLQGTSLRARANWALNFAVDLANQLGLPVLAYHGLRPDYPWASDRIHSHILESARDLESDFHERGIQYAFFLQPRKPGAESEPSPLVRLGRRAAAVVTDWFPTFIQPRQLRGLRQKLETPVIAIDSTTVVPVRAFGHAFSTARAFRPRLMELVEHHLFPVPDPEPAVSRRIELPFDPPDLSDIPGLLAGCDIDHTVPPSPVIRGGTRAARRRLKAFLRDGLPRFAAERSDPNAGAASGLSPYLHFGNISIQEVALAVRDADPGPNGSKFLDEALTWRELAHNFVTHEPRHRTLEAVPGWARRELDDHAADPRPALYTLEELEQARTGDELWNACQRALVREGALHNYLRMLWGKQVIQWTRDAAEALTFLEHLNHRFALDGRDPNSYGGIHWCFGKFDRPFYRRPVYGLVRYMSTRAARDKFDVPRYLARYPA